MCAKVKDLQTIEKRQFKISISQSGFRAENRNLERDFMQKKGVSVRSEVLTEKACRCAFWAGPLGVIARAGEN